jgi:hypothetical protein
LIRPISRTDSYVSGYACSQSSYTVGGVEDATATSNADAGTGRLRAS